MANHMNRGHLTRNAKLAFIEIDYYVHLDNTPRPMEVAISMNNSSCRAGLTKRNILWDHQNNRNKNPDDYDLVCLSSNGSTVVVHDDEPLDLCGSDTLLLVPRGSMENNPARVANMRTVVLRQHAPNAQEIYDYGNIVNE